MRAMREIKTHGVMRRFTALLLCLCMIAAMISDAGISRASAAGGTSGGANGGTSGVTRQADPSTMDTYKEMLDFSQNTRYAGRLWSDKTVFALDYRQSEASGLRDPNWDGKNLTLNKADDGVDQKITLDEDFLHVYSVLGSSQAINAAVPVDLMLALDITASMLNSGSNMPSQNHDTTARTTWKGTLEGTGAKNSNMALSLDAANELISQIRESIPNSRISIVVFHGSGYQMVPFVDGDVAFTGYSVRYDVAGTDSGNGLKGEHPQAILHYTITNSKTASVPNGDYVYDSISGAHYRYPEGEAPANDTWSGKDNAEDQVEPKDNKTFNQEHFKLGLNKEAGGVDVIAEDQKYKEQGISSTDDGSPTQLGGGTGLEGGIYTAMSAVAAMRGDTTYTMPDGTNVSRIPVIVIQGDGATNHVLIKEGDPDAEREPGDDSHRSDPVYDGGPYNAYMDRTSGKNSAIETQLKVNGSSDEWWSIKSPIATACTYADSTYEADFNAVLQAAYWKAAIANAYGKNLDDVFVYTVGLGAKTSVLNPDVGFAGTGDLEGYTDRRELYKAFNAWRDKSGMEQYPDDDDKGNIKYNEKDDHFQGGEKLNFYIDPNGDSSTFHIEALASQWGYDKKGNDPYGLERPEMVYNYARLPAEDENGVTMKDLELNYTRQYFFVESNTESSAETVRDTLSGAFAEIVKDVYQSAVFVPVSGMNDLGVGNAVTFMDPMGKYMEVKDIKGVSLFGCYYGIVKTAVYDYQWNDAYMKHYKEGTGHGKDPLPQGWYRGDPSESGISGVEYAGQDNGIPKLPENCNDSQAAWNAGWVFRVGYTTAAQFVPTLNTINNPDSALTKEKQTVYTFYRLDTFDGEPLSAGEREKLHVNPVYLAKDQKESDYIGNITYDPSGNGSHLDQKAGVYALADLRIWVEDSGDYSDSLGDTITDTNYDEALWVNVPVNMLPLRKITINENADGGFTYETNIPANPSTVQAGSPESASFPLRVFYTVGVSDEVLEASNRINMAGAIDAEYILKNKITTAEAAAARGIPQGSVEFFSNWYNPLNRYGDYATTNTDYTYGDPVTSFSPANGNRYYLFEKALPLYSAAYQYKSGAWQKVTIAQSAEDGTLPADFGGRLLDTLDSITGVDSISEKLGGKSPQEGDVVLVKTDLLTDVNKNAEGGDPFSSDGYYFLAIEYYNLEAGNKAEFAQYVITRKGSEFGSAYGSAHIANGDMLVWHDMSGTYPDYPYLSATDTGDKSRGKDYIGWPLDENGYFVGCDKNSEDKNQWVPKTANYDDAKGKASGDYADDWNTQHSNVLNAEGAEWVVCAKPGGLRVGDLAQAVQEKTGDYVSNDNITNYYRYQRYTEAEWQSLTWGFYANNVTRTANNYYMPTISAGSTSSDVRVNTYLGNNGRLYVMDTTLLVTKLVEEPNSSDLINNGDEFDYQIFINGITGPQSAVVVKYSGEDGENGSWQRQFHYIDLQLDTQLFLQTQDGQKALVDSEGCRLVDQGDGNYTYAEKCTSSSGKNHAAGESYDPDTDTVNGASGPYYVFIGKNETQVDGAADTGFRVYHNPEVHGEDSGTNVGSADVTYEGSFGEVGTFYATTVGLVSLSKYAGTWQAEGSAPDPVNDPAFKMDKYKGNFDKTLSRFALMTIDPNVQNETSALSFDTPYLTASAYWTKTVYFGYKADGNTKLTGTDIYDQIIPLADRPDLFTSTMFGEGKTTDNENFAQYTGEFTLKNGYGLLFSGIPSNSVYRVTEKLTKEQMEKGYTLKEVSHNQQVGSVSTYRPGVQSIPVYYHEGTTYGDIYPSGAEYMPDTYRNNITQYGLTWALNQDGTENNKDYLHYEPFFNTNAVVWEAYSTADKTAGGDNHHQPAGVPKGTSVFWLWDSGTNLNKGGSHTVLDNPSCKPLAQGGCDEEIDNVQVRHYFFKDGALRDAHYYGEGSGYLRDFARFVTSPTVHFAVENEPQQKNQNPATNKFNSSVAYTGVYSVYGNTGTYEESANFVNTIKRDKTETQINGEDVTPDLPEHPNTYPGVLEGDEITYKIDWTNDSSADARIVIIDQLDEGVDYVSATDGARYFKDRDEANKYLAEIYDDPKKPVTVDSGHVVIWDLGVKGKDASGSVELTVKVNGKAEKWWDYDGDGVADKPEEPDDDYMVRNRATVRVADNAYTTNTTRNPVGEPEKKETEIERGNTENTKLEAKPGESLTEPRKGDPETEDGPLVYAGDTITYEITWRNYQNESAAVTVKDLLDPNVEFVSASFNPADTKWNDAEKSGAPSHEASDYKGASSTELSGTNESENKVTVGSDSLPVIKYDPDTRTVTWNLGEQTAMTNGKVTVKVKVLPSAAVPGQVENTARVKVGSGPWQDTHTLVNPTPEVDKDETAINGGEVEPQSSDGDRTLYPEVEVGDTVSYEIDWKAKEERELNSIVVTDPLDPGVDFVSASYTFTTGGEDVTVTLNDPTKTATSTQTVTGAEHANQPMVTIKYDAATHTVTWTLYGDAVVPEGHVELTVRVTSRAVEDKESKNLSAPGDMGDAEDWEYRDGNGLEPEGQLVQNRGAVKFNNDAFLTTDLVENPLTPDKTEVSPGSGQLVGVGDQIDYSISYQNYTGEQADVIVRDPLDVGVDFLSAQLGGATVTKAQAAANWDKLTAEQQKYIQDPKDPSFDNNPVEISQGVYYDAESHMVVWVIENVSAQGAGKVLLSVTVNEDAAVRWEYTTPEGSSNGQATADNRGGSVKKDGDGELLDHNVYDRATVQVGNEPEIFTRTVENHIPDKQPGEKYEENASKVRDTAHVGEEVPFNITWHNDKENAQVVVTDKLQKGAEFVSASFGGVTLEAGTVGNRAVGGRKVKVDGQEVDEIVIEYDPATRTVKWTLSGQPVGDGQANVTLKITEDVLEAGGELLNEAVVNGSHTPQVRLHAGMPTKTETGIEHKGSSVIVQQPEGAVDWTGPTVFVDDIITYKIAWENYKDEEALVTVFDKLEPNLEFVSAEFVQGDLTSGAPSATLTSAWENGKAPSGQSSQKVDIGTSEAPNNVPVITYDAATRTVTWNLGKQNAGAKGEVVIRVKVMSGASDAGRVWNKAYVKINGDSAQETPEIENPTPKTEKKETTPGDGARVDVGDDISYQVSWDAGKVTGDEDETLKSLKVTDPLDPGVDFVSASYTFTTSGRNVTVTLTDPTATAVSEQKVEVEGVGNKPMVKIEYDSTTHTVVWTFYGDAAVRVGHVDLTVKVTARALPPDGTFGSHNGADKDLPGSGSGDWDYREDDGIETGSGQLVQNRAIVTFPSGDMVTELQKNPLTPDKTEVTPGDRELVGVGDPIQYKIFYQNYTEVTARVIVRDPLDPGVDFVSATLAGKTYDLAAAKAAYEAVGSEIWEKLLNNDHTDDAELEIGNGVYYDATSHMVIWIVNDVPTLQTGEVVLNVKVNRDAKKTWNYKVDEHSGTGDADKDYQVLNRAGVQVGNGPEIFTSTVENPVPDKDETKINGETPDPEMKPKEGTDDTEVGPTVKVGDQITYEIGFRNDRDVPVDIVIRDELDPGVEFVSASYGGVTAENTSDKLTARSEKVTPLDGEPYWPVTVSYDRDSRTVTWTLKNVAPGAYKVTLVVEVTSKAVKAGVVDNQAEVRVGNRSVKTDIVENPTPKTEKTETRPGQGMIVRPGDEVEYAISWRNHQPDRAKVVITDCLDPGVDFRSAWLVDDNGRSLTIDFEGPGKPTEAKTATDTLTIGGQRIPVTVTYEPGAHTITWTLGTDENGADGVPAGYEGTVRFTVEVNEKAFDKYEYNDKAEPKKGEGEDDQILNQGSVKVGNDVTYTEIVDNPLKPKKKETAIDDVEVQVGETGPKVKVGDIITYTISWMNDAREGDDPIPADVIVTDQLGTGLEFVDAGFVVFDAEGKLTYPTGKPDGYGDCTVSASGRTVTWTLPDRAANATGMVWIRARVTSDAVNEVTNTGSVTDGSNTWTLPEIKNPVDSGLIIEKVVENGDAGDRTKRWHFTVALTAPAEEDIPWGSITWKLVGGDSDPEVFIDAVEGTISFTLRHGEYLSLGGLPVGTRYEVVEEEANIAPYTTRVDEEHDPAVGATKDGAQTWVRFVNVRSNTPPPPPPGSETVELTVDKTVAGEKGDTERLWHFTVTLDRPLTGWYGDMYFTNGAADFTLKHGQSATATGLPEGVQYTVTEAEANADGYVTNSQGASGTLSGSNYAHFINKLGDEERDHELVVEKTVTGALGDRNREWTFGVELSDRTLNGWYGNLFFVNGVSQFTLKHGESRYATGLPEGVTYRVLEKEANQDGYTTRSTGASGTIIEGSVKASFENSKRDDSPQTGDITHQRFWIGLIIVSAVGFAVTLLIPSDKMAFLSLKGKHNKRK